MMPEESEPPVEESGPGGPVEEAAPAQEAAPAGEAAPVKEAGPAEAHHDDGLDLARTLARATAGTTPRARRTRGPAAAGPRRGVRSSGSHPDDRDPQTVESTLARLVSDHGWELDLRLRSVFARWAELVGDEVAGHSTPESFADGRLVVRAHSTAWATQLRLLAPSIVGRLNDELGPATVTVIEVAGPRGPGWTRTRWSTRDSRGPRDTYG